MERFDLFEPREGVLEFLPDTLDSMADLSCGKVSVFISSSVSQAPMWEDGDPTARLIV